MHIHMYSDVPNFGDVLNKHIWKPYLGDAVGRNDGILMFGIGTLLGEKISHDGEVIVCGTGCGYLPHLENIDTENWKIFFVRGPHTARALNLPLELAITDPAILTPEIYPAAAKSGQVIFIPHWETSYNPLWKSACHRAGIHYVDPLASHETVIAAISGAKLVIAEAMHAAILADAYRVPWIAVSTSPRINKFKWSDWGNSLSMEPVLHHLPQLGASDFFRNFMADTKTASALEKYRPYSSHPLDRRNIFYKALNSIYYAVTTLKFRNRLEHYAISKLGRRIDRQINQYTSSKLFLTMIDPAVQKLASLKQETGVLSTQEISDTKKREIKKRLASVKEYLDSSRIHKEDTKRFAA